MNPLHVRPETHELPISAARLGFDDSLADEDETAGQEASPLSCGSALPDKAPRLSPLDENKLTAWIVDIAEQRDERALAALYDATIARVYSLVLRVLRRPAWAEEVVEDTYFQVWRQAIRFDPKRGRPVTWLLAMARSRAIDAWRRESRFDHASLDSDEAQAFEDTRVQACDDWLDCTRGNVLLHQAIAVLPAQPRQLVALAFFRGFSHEEIAESMAMPLGTVKSQIRRALATMRQALGDSGQVAVAVRTA